MGDRIDALIIGAGHNGLVCGFYLARAGLKVHIIEALDTVGGCAVTQEFHPGFRNSVASYTVSLLQPRVIADMALPARGYRVIERPVSNFLPLPDGDSLMLGPDIAREVGRFSARDAAALPEYHAMLDAAADVLRDLALKEPPAIDGGLSTLVAAATQSRGLRALPRLRQQQVLRLFTRSAREVLDDYFESDPIKAAYGFDAVVGNYASPDSPGSAYVLLHHVFGEVNGNKGAWGHAVGGMGAITQMMAEAAREAGATIELNAPVERVLVEKARAVGVQLSDGRTIMAGRVIANLGPKPLFGKLIDADHLPADFRAAMQGFKVGSGAFRMNVALSELPRFTARPDPGDHLKSGIIIAPSLDYMHRAFEDARTFGWSREPIVEMLIPSLADDSLAPPGRHVASLFCQQFDPELEWTPAQETAAADAIIATVDAQAPGFATSILARQVLSPRGLEARFNLAGGDIFHGRMSLDQLWAARPVLGAGNYRGPLKGLYLCGAGTHPGGGVTGAPGHNAAMAVLRDRRWW